jgi:hypothetical protein
MAKDLLKEAIADAKAVREVALQNAKMALEEAFDSKIKNMLSARLAEELEEDFELEEMYEEDSMNMEGGFNPEVTSKLVNAITSILDGYYDDIEAGESVVFNDVIQDFEIDEEGLSSITNTEFEIFQDDEFGTDLVRKNPSGGLDFKVIAKVSTNMMEENLDLDEEIDLDELMAELEMNEADEDEEMEEGLKDLVGKAGKAVVKLGNRDAVKFLKDVKAKGMLDDFKKAVENGTAPNKPEFKALFGSGMSNGEKMAAISIAAELEFGKNIGGKSSGIAFESTNEDFDIDALISEIEAELEEGKMKDSDKEEVEEAKKRAKQAEEELEEALATVSSLRESISEMNLLNSKLLYCNKLFRANSLTEAQKVKVIDALDMANTASEAKLVYSTLQESFKFTGVEKKSIQEGLARASKPAGVAPKKVITESVDDTVNRFQKLANIQF